MSAISKSHLAILVSASLLPGLSHAANIELTITGQGSVQIQENNTSCGTSCSLSNSLALSTLKATPSPGWEFTGWSGQMCDAGNRAILTKQRKYFDKAPGGAKTLAAADFNGDEIIDLVGISLFDGTVNTLINQGNSGFSKHEVATRLAYPAAVDTFDWDGDGDIDFLVTEYGRGAIKLYENDGNGNFSFSKDLNIDLTNANGNAYAIAIADINQDQLPDLLISSFKGDTSGDLFQLVNSISSADTSWYINQGNELIKSHQVSDKAAITLDVYRQGQDYLVAAAEIVSGEVALYHSDGQRQVIDRGNGTYGVAFGDIDNNGRADVLTAHYRPSQLKLIYNLGEGQYGEAQLLDSPGEGVTATAFGDFNKDGYLDVASGIFNNKDFYYLTTESYQDCIISSDSKITLTANFAQTQVPTPTPTPETPNSDSSGGGATGHWLLLLTGLLLGRRRKYA
jgi:hypothetical protein